MRYALRCVIEISLNRSRVWALSHAKYFAANCISNNFGTAVSTCNYYLISSTHLISQFGLWLLFEIYNIIRLSNSMICIINKFVIVLNRMKCPLFFALLHRAQKSCADLFCRIAVVFVPPSRIIASIIYKISSWQIKAISLPRRYFSPALRNFPLPFSHDPSANHAFLLRVRFPRFPYKA